MKCRVIGGVGERLSPRDCEALAALVRTARQRPAVRALDDYPPEVIAAETWYREAVAAKWRKWLNIAQGDPA